MIRIGRILKKELLIHFGGERRLLLWFIYPSMLVFSSGFALGGAGLTGEYFGLFFWIIIYTAVISIGTTVFSHERDLGTEDFLSFYYSPYEIFLAKYLFILIVSIGVSLAVSISSCLFLVHEVRPLSFMLTLLFGNFAMTALLTLVSALSVISGGGASLSAILATPLMLPLFLVLVRLLSSFEPKMLSFLFVYGVFVLLLSLLLFEKLWKER